MQTPTRPKHVKSNNFGSIFLSKSTVVILKCFSFVISETIRVIN